MPDHPIFTGVTNRNMAATTTIHNEMEQENREKHSEAREGGNIERKAANRDLHFTPEMVAHTTKVERAGKSHSLLRKRTE